jgi:hypothetical protein
MDAAEDGSDEALQTTTPNNSFLFRLHFSSYERCLDFSFYFDSTLLKTAHVKALPCGLCYIVFAVASGK